MYVSSMAMLSESVEVSHGGKQTAELVAFLDFQLEALAIRKARIIT